jgi:hypothetical protein
MLHNPSLNLTLSSDQCICAKPFDGRHAGKDGLCPAALFDKSLCEILA